MGWFGRMTKLGAGMARNRMRRREEDDLDELEELEEGDGPTARPTPEPSPRPARPGPPVSKKRSL